MAFWTCNQTAASAEHVHEFDEYMLVVQGCYTLLIGGRRIPVNAGEEYLIPRGAQPSEFPSQLKKSSNPLLYYLL